MKVKLGKLARSGIESQLGTDVTATVETAVCHFTGKLESGRPPLPPPEFLDLRPARGEEIEVALDADTEAIFRREAFRRGIGVDAMAAHSVLTYLAEIDFLSRPGRPV